MGLKKTQAQEYAKTLFLDTDQKLTIQEISERVSVRPNTVSKWIKDGNWEKLRTSLLITRQAMITDLYNQLQVLNDHIKSRAIVYDIPDKLLKGTVVKDKQGNEKVSYPDYNPEDYPILIGNYPTSKEANTQIAITNNIKKLETETSIAEVYEVSTGLLEFIKPQDFDLFKKLVPIIDAFINTKLR
ncbi:MAG: hypothetical protein JJE55_08215 [Flavobacteriaceae bacterium]|nr:hypothetical protein [Flavobacteriaceae bacterium]